MPSPVTFKDVVRYDNDVVPGSQSEQKLVDLASAAGIFVTPVKRPGDTIPGTGRVARTLFLVQAGDQPAPPQAAGVIGTAQQTVRDVWGAIKAKYFQNSGGAIILPGVELAPGPDPMFLNSISAWNTSTVMSFLNWTPVIFQDGVQPVVAFRRFASPGVLGPIAGTFFSGYVPDGNMATPAWSSGQLFGDPAYVVLDIDNYGWWGKLGQPANSSSMVMDLSGWSWTTTPGSPVPTIGGSTDTTLTLAHGVREFWYLTTASVLYLAQRYSINPDVAPIPARSLAEAYTAAHGGGVQA